MSELRNGNGAFSAPRKVSFYWSLPIRVYNYEPLVDGKYVMIISRERIGYLCDGLVPIDRPGALTNSQGRTLWVRDQFNVA